MDAGTTVVLYFSGNGNTRYAVERLARGLGVADEAILSIEKPMRTLEQAVAGASTLLIAHPNYMCVLPKIVSDFVTEHREWFRDKTLITLVTYANFFFDADLQIGRLLQKLNIPFELNSNISVQMPMVICDMKYIKRTDDETMRRLKEQAEVKLDECARRILAGSSVHDGQESDRLKAFLRQRMFYGGKMSRDFAGLHVSANCTGCGLCIRSCPTRNLALKEGRAEQQGRCTQCYRCANNCPEQAISLWTKQIQWQYPGITA